MKTFLITSARETARQENIKKLCDSLADVDVIEAVYPAFQHVPFLKQIIAVTKERTGRAQLPAEIGCLMSHRKIWQKIMLSNALPSTHFLILESDSELSNASMINELTAQVEEQYDLFFWGAWLGHMRLFRTSKQRVGKKHSIGTPFIKTVYCTYGYSVNKAAAAYLLQKTKKIAYPVDQFKQFVHPDDLRIGGIYPEIIQSGNLGTYIDQVNWKNWQHHLFMNLLDIKNNLICFFK